MIAPWHGFRFNAWALSSVQGREALLRCPSQSSSPSKGINTAPLYMWILRAYPSFPKIGFEGSYGLRSNPQPSLGLIAALRSLDKLSWASWQNLPKMLPNGVHWRCIKYFPFTSVGFRVSLELFDVPEWQCFSINWIDEALLIWKFYSLYIYIYPFKKWKWDANTIIASVIYHK